MLDDWNSYLVSFDTDHIKEYLFATNRLKEIRGASALLAWLDDRRRDFLAQKCGKDNLIYSAGGSASVLVENQNQADQLIAEVERDFGHRTQSASITGTLLKPYEPFSQEQIGADQKKFGARMQAARIKLNMRKMQRAEVNSIPVQPYFRLCNSCGQYPATRRSRHDSADLLCWSCDRKRRWGERSRLSFFYKFASYVQETKHDTTWKAKFIPNDLGDIGDVSVPNGYVGYLTLDGNRMGEQFEKLLEKQRYQIFSEELAKLTKEITFDALYEYTRRHTGTVPFEIVLIGGDDIKLFTAADIAVPVARYIISEFETRSKVLLQKIGLAAEKGCTMAAGVVLCHSNFPIPALVDIGEELLKSAKRLCAEHKYAESAIDFEVITSSAADLDIARAQVPHNKPYTLSQIDRLLHYAQQLREKEIPHTQLQMVYDACHHSKVMGTKVEGTMALLHTLGRLRQREQREVLKRFLIEFSEMDVAKATHWPWIMVHKEKEQPETPLMLKTALVDLIDLYEFTRNGD
ncbi:MAG: hypothetical protein ONB42_20055 [candidate division KSB1 bacterium]|nr:hypothetical protein [candidate division KSB1 bacterium]